MSNKEFKVGFIENEIFKVVRSGSKYRLHDINGDSVENADISVKMRKSAEVDGKALQGFIEENGVKIYRKVSMDIYNSLVSPLNVDLGKPQDEDIDGHAAIKKFIHEEALTLKPKELIIKDLKWKYLIRSAVRAKNIMMTGPSGCGKTMAAKALVRVLERPDFYFNLGATQDPRATLIGNTHFDSKKGTFFAESAFVKAIQTPNAIILLDELSRAHPDAWNILMTPLDQGQRYLRLDEKDGSPTINVAEGVTFIATANIGAEYTSTRVMDRAILDRFVTIEMDVLNKDEEYELLKSIYPTVSDYDLKAVAEIADTTRKKYASEEDDLSAMISTRATVEMVGLLYDGFSLVEGAEIAILPFFSNDGGVDSDRTKIKQLIQKFADDNGKGLYDDTEDVIDDNGTDIPKF